MADDPIPDSDVATPSPADTIQPTELRPAQPGEASDSAEARGAREAMEHLPRMRRQEPATPPVPAVRESRVEENPYERYLKGPQDDGPADLERMRLNRVNTYYRSGAGALDLKLKATIYNEKDPPDMDPAMKTARQKQRDEYEDVLLDLMRYDMMPSWSGLPQLGAAVAGSVAGSISPENFIGWAAGGATWVARTMRAAMQQGLITGVTDPAVQALNISAGAQDEYHPEQTAGSFLFGAALGGGMHGAGEGLGHFLGQRELRHQLGQLGKIDQDVLSADMARWEADPRNGLGPNFPLNPDNGIPAPEGTRPEMDVLRPQMPEASPEPRASAGPEAGTPRAEAAPVSDQPRYQPGPEHGFEDAVKAEKTRLRNSYGAAQPKASRMSEEARFSAFNDEVGDILQAKVEEHALDPDSVRYGDIWKFYERAPGQAPEEALESAIGRWVTEEERRAIQSPINDAQLQRDLDEWERAYDSERERMSTYSQEVDASTQMPSRFGGRQQANHTLPGVSTIFRDYRPAHIPEEDIPFEHVRPNAPEGGNLPAGGEAQPREAQGADGGGAEPAVRGERGGGAAAGGEAPTAAPTDRGEKLGGLAEALGGKPANVPKEAPDIIYSGSGRTDSKGIYNGTEFPIAGPGTYFSFSEKHAKTFGPNVRKASIGEVTKNPLVIDNDDAWRALTKEAGWEFPNPFGKSKEEMAKMTADLQAAVKTKGHDGLVVWFDRNEPTDSTAYRMPDGRWSQKTIKNLRNVFDEPQVIGFERPLATERTVQGEQTVMPGAERESPEAVAARQRTRDKEEAEARMRGRKGGGAPQESAEDLALFGGERQKDLLALRGERATPMAGEERRDDLMNAAVTPMSPDEQVKLKSLHQLAVGLAEKLDIPLRQGRMGNVSADTHGFYKTKSGVIRMRETADFEVVKHEVGHAIEAKVGPDLTTLTQQHTFELAPLDYDQSATGKRVNEGFAEWMRIRMTNPAGAQRLAPNFYNDFEALMLQKRPDILKVMNDTAAAHRAFLDADPLSATATMVRNTVPLGNMKQISREIAEEGLTPTTGVYLTKAWQWMQRQYDHYFDNFQDMERATREMLGIKQEQQGGGLVDFNAARDPSILIRSIRRAGQGAKMALDYGITPWRQLGPVGPAFKDVLNEALGNPRGVDHLGRIFNVGRWSDSRLESFDQYVAARMSSYLWERYDQGLIPKEPSPIKPGQARVTIDELERLNPSFKRAGDMLQEMYSQVRKKKLDSGLWSPDTFKLTSEYEFYVPMKRVMEDSAVGGGGTAATSDSLKSSVRKRVGSERDIDSPLRNVMRDIFFMEQEIRQNDMKGALINLATSIGPEGGKFIERLPQHEAKVVRARLDDMIKERADQIGLPPAEAQTMIDTLLNGEDGPLVGESFKMQQAAANGEPIIFHWEGGEPIPYRVMSRNDKAPEGVVQGRYKLFQLMSEAPAPAMDAWSNFITIGAAGLRGGITNNPMFALSNYIKDQLQVALSQPGYIPFIGGIKGTLSEVFQGQIARERAEAGGVMGGSLVGEVERKFEANLADMAKQGYLVKRLTSVKGILEFMQVTEAGTRNSIFEIVKKQKLKQGLSPFEAAQEAGARSTDIMDFSRHGDRMDQLRRMVPFLNASFQGSERYFYRGLVEPFLRKVLTVADQEARNRAYYTWLMSAGGGISAGMAYAALNWEKEVYRDAQPEVMGTSLVIPGVNGEVGLFPKPFELSAGFTAGEYAYKYWVKNDPRGAAQFVEALRSSLTPPNPITNTPIVTPIIELKTNHSFFRDGPVVPDSVRNTAFPELEYDDKTSSLAKYLGKQMGWSPMKVDYAMGSLFGSSGRDFMSATSMVDKDSPTTALDDTVFVRRYIKNAERISGRTKEFWQLMGAKNGKYASDADAYRKLVDEATRRGQPLDAASKLLDSLPASERAYVTLHEGANARGKPAFSTDDRRMHPLSRAHEAVTVLNGIAKDLNSNTLIPYREKERIQISPDDRRLLIDDIRTMAGAEMRNAMVAVGQPGYVGRPIYDLNDYMDVIRKVSPVIAKEIGTRYATAKILTFDAVREAWPEVQKDLIRYGTEANIRSLTAHARANGYEFGENRAKKPGIPRRPIGGAASPPH